MATRSVRGHERRSRTGLRRPLGADRPTLNDGDSTFSGAFAAGYDKKRKAVRAAKRACKRDRPGSTCTSVATARNGWAALVVTAREDGTLVVLAGDDKSYFSAFAEAEARAREAFGGTTPNEIARVRAVRSRAKGK